MKNTVAFLVLALVNVSVGMCACGPSAPAVAPRAVSRAAVDIAKDAWVLTANACIDVAQAEGDAGAPLEAKCASYLSEAHDLILAAGEAVDTNWSSKAACDLAQAAMLVAGAADSLPLNSNVKAAAADAKALAMASAASSACASDAGSDR